jgi:SAM-dependent methyltransferase
VFLRDDIEHTAWWSKESLQIAKRIADGEETLQELAWDGNGVHPHVQSIIDSTGGYLYQACKGHLQEYPIPRIRIQATDKKQLLLDGGCNWGRWTLAAARAGIASVGVDPSLGAVVAARRIRQQLQLPCTFFVGDCRWLPFPAGAFSDVFSYSVIQHFSKADARLAVGEFCRILRPAGRCMVQMPNCFGLRSGYHLLRRRFHPGKNFDVRYYTPHELRTTFRNIFGNANLSVDGFLGLGIQADDLRMMPLRNRVIIRTSEALRKAASWCPPLKNLADSLYVSCVREKDG